MPTPWQTAGAAARMGVAKAALDGHRPTQPTLGSCQSPQVTDTPVGAKLEPLIQVEQPQVRLCHAWCHLHGLRAGGTSLASQELS